MRKNRIMDFSGKKVYVGIDVHKKTYSVCCRCDKQVVKKATMGATAGRLVDFLKFHFAGAEVYCAYEAGFSGFILHRVLMANGVNNLVVNPSSIETAANDRVKTDKRDAAKVSEQLEAGRLKGIFVPTLEQEQQRLVTRTRAQLVRERTRIGNQFKSRLSQFGLIPHDDETKMSKAFIDDYLNQDLAAPLKQSLSVLARVWKSLDMEIEALKREMAKIGAEQRVAIIYQSVPGIGPVASVVLALELGDMSQFRNERTIFKHTGLIPGEHSSGEHIRKGHITRQGSSRLRLLLTEAAWKAIKDDPKLAADFNRIAHKRGKKRAIVAIARKLIGRIRACLRKNQTYELGFGMAA